MVMTRYEKGRTREYRAMSILRNDGWLVARSAASHGAVDIFAAKDGKILLLQVKSGVARLKKAEAEELVRWGKYTRGEAQVWHFKQGGKIERRRIYAFDTEDPK
jgi:Holliday junction resolvase